MIIIFEWTREMNNTDVQYANSEDDEKSESAFAVHWAQKCPERNECVTRTAAIILCVRKRFSHLNNYSE